MKKSKLPKQALIILSIALVLVISTVMWSSAQITQDTEEEVQSTPGCCHAERPDRTTGAP